MECPVCENTFQKFLPYGVKGGENRLCPTCLSLERHRMIWHYLQHETEFFTKQYKMLHFAPEQCFLKRFKALKNLDYTTADLVSPIADLHCDIQDIPLEDNSFDIVFCNHVLEHVPDDHKAMKELYRVLKPGGFGILQVPQNMEFEHTYEDSSITSQKEREIHFGQYDHLRLYGKDYASELEEAGFIVEEINYVEKVGEEYGERIRIRATEPLYIVKKQLTA